MANSKEAAFKEVAEFAGFKAYHTGWPDFLLYHPISKKVILVEIKACKGQTQLRANQRIIQRILKEKGFSYHIIHLGKNPTIAREVAKKEIAKILQAQTP